MQLNIIFSGVGGQGIIAASDVYCEAALLDGFDVAKAETHGMAQRGGSIITHVRIGEDISSPLIETGSADIIVGFEVLEAVRALPLLRYHGKVIMNTKYIPPSTVVQGLVKAPVREELFDLVKKKARHVYEVDGIRLAQEAGNVLVMNMVLLGALLAISESPIKEESLKKAISRRLNAKYQKANFKALALGKKAFYEVLRR
jgi:indolepyruvate ferredoxin oxidoreductase beta subunit